jgi:putative oxidoreductase
MDKLKALWKAVIDILDPAGDWVALLPIRLLMAYEFFKAGLTKFNGSNWFGNIQDNFPFPFNVIPVEISWFLATWICACLSVCSHASGPSALLSSPS